jgi:hypothetical protein
MGLEHKLRIVQCFVDRSQVPGVWGQPLVCAATLQRSDPRLHRFQYRLRYFQRARRVFYERRQEVILNFNDVGDVKPCKTEIDSCSCTHAGLTAAPDACGPQRWHVVAEQHQKYVVGLGEARGLCSRLKSQDSS